MKDLIRNLTEACGPSGREEQVRSRILEATRGFADEVRDDALGNLIVRKRGTGSGAKRVMVSAHMDEIGIIVTHIDKQGFLRFGAVGGVFTPTLPGGRVQFTNGAVGVIGWEKWLHGSEARPPMEELYVDVGATSPQDSPVKVGDMACFMRSCEDLGARIVAKAMDDRIGCAVAVQALREMGSSPHDVYFVFSTQEEVGPRGALVSAYAVEPTVGIAVDVTDTGDTPEKTPMAVSLAGGPAIKVMDDGAITHPGVKNWMIDVAERAGLRYQLEVLTFGGTDAMAIQRTRAGVPVGCLSVPCRYIHTPSEMVDYGDVLGAVKLLVAMLVGDVPL